MSAAAVFGLSGPRLGAQEAAFFADVEPWGFILFKRNIETRDQVVALTAALRASVGRNDAAIFVDQEGGKVQRLGPPHWPRSPAAGAYSVLPQEVRAGMVRLGARLIAHDLAEVGITVDCLPVLDVASPGAHEIIGDRAYGEDPDMVASLGRAACEGLLAGAVLPVVKHIPGHGRARADSHLALPVVEASVAELEDHDFAPFRALADMPMAMTAHVVYAALDRDRPATTSPVVIERAIRGAIGFDGLLISDDLSMNALRGGLADRAAASLAAGCDVVLHCNGDMAEMGEVAAAAGELSPKAAIRASSALRRRAAEPEAFDSEAAWVHLRAALAGRLAA
ncbi:MAG: beta-N-acetylhexosaminidase [Caulobacteraceae bacterium]